MFENNTTPIINKSSNRSFGITFSIFSFLIYIYFLFFYQTNLIFFLIISILFFLFGFFYPKIFKYPNIYWSKFGLFLNKLISPIILIFIYVTIFSVISAIYKILGKDVLGKYDKKKITYWKERSDIKTFFENQF